jgi:hypothetical protein
MQYNYATRTAKILYIVVHDTGNKSVGANAQANVNYFNSGDRQASADLFVDDKGTIAFNTDMEKYYSWHCGDGAGRYGITNGNSVGLEICVNADGNYEKAVTNALEQVRLLMTRFGIDLAHVVRHYDASRKTCPNTMIENNWALWTVFKNRLAGVASAPVAPVVSNTIITIQKQLNDKCKAGLVADGIAGVKTTNAIKAFQTSQGLTADGVWGVNTANAMNKLYVVVMVKPVVPVVKPINNPVTAPAVKQMYRIRLTWANVKSQIGAYTDLVSAKAIADKNPTYTVFNASGVAVYKK